MEYTIKLDPKNTLFPSEMKLLKNTISTILGYMYTKNLNELAKGTIGKDPHSYGEYKILHDAVHGEQDIDNIRTIYHYVRQQQLFLANNVASAFGKQVGSFEVIAKRLEVILFKMKSKIIEIQGLYGSTPQWLEAIEKMQHHFNSHTCNEDCGTCPIIEICYAP